MQGNAPIQIEPGILSAIESCTAAETLDDLFEVFLSRLLHVGHVRRAEIFLFDKRKNLLPVARGINLGTKGDERQEIWVQGWLMDSSVKHTTRKVLVPSVLPEFALPLVGPKELLGFLHIQLDQIPVDDGHSVHGFHLAALHLATKVREILLYSEMDEIKAELRTIVSNSKEYLQQVTSLSKELYALTAISTRLNQSMDFKKCLEKSVAKIKEVFKVSGVLVYTREPGRPQLQLSASDLEAELPDPHFLQRARRFLHREIISGGKPFAKGRLPPTPTSSSDHKGVDGALHILGAPLKSKEKTLGTIALLTPLTNSFDEDGLRLMSGIANIMAMAIENLSLYRQSERKKKEAAFLVRSIAKFNEKLDVKQTLRSVAEKGAEFIGGNCRVYLFSETNFPMIQAEHQSGNGRRWLSSRAFRRIEPKELADFYEAIKPEDQSMLIRNISRSRRLTDAVRLYLQEEGFYSLIVVPLRLKGKEVGLFIIGDGKHSRPLERRDLFIVKALGDAACVAIQNAQVHFASVEMSEFLEKKIMEKTSEIHHIQERQRSRIESRKDIIFRVNRRNRFVFVNRAMEELTGCTREELYQGRIKAEDVVHREDRDKVKGLLEKILKGELSVASGLEYRHISRNGETHVISLTVYPEVDASGKIKGFEGVGTDITDQKRLEAELEKAKDLAILGEFSGAVAHQLRNPLGNILMGTKLLQKALGADIQVSTDEKSLLVQADKKNLSKIFLDLSEGINNLNQVVTELLEYTKTLKLRKSSQRIEVLLKESLQMFQDSIKQRGIRVVEGLDPHVPEVQVDAVLMGQVFRNVLHNAIQAMPKGGTLAVFTHMDAQRPDHLCISISDSGVGVEPSERDKLFRPFYTTKDSGTGLGLSLAHKITEAHKGMIWACINPCPHQFDWPLKKGNLARFSLPKGLTIHVVLPTSPAEGIQLAPQERENEPASLGR